MWKFSLGVFENSSIGQIFLYMEQYFFPFSTSAIVMAGGSLKFSAKLKYWHYILLLDNLTYFLQQMSDCLRALGELGDGGD